MSKDHGDGAQDVGVPNGEIGFVRQLIGSDYGER
jgi:hypothetical protein